MYRIITVCTGNICRSPMAQYVLTKALADAGLAAKATVDSAGTTNWEAGRPIDHRAAARLKLAGLATSGHRARQFLPTWYRERDLILALDLDHYEQLRRDAPDDESRAKVRMFRSFDPALADKEPSAQGIYDPWFGDEADFEASWDMISSAVPGIVDHVRAALATR
ncbi:protein tyrosine phosphatase [Arthrobacter crystallopoietes BAB-32]|uniref:protein-tyrosine-phosphatase n=1 Tax=Arthrobacter crystallopoietes BAB-32 TaxID=1246476 RepID=N1V0N1_9MICC|nr:low molecular weight protein-tyrosine-phosphatase [Arthrobacter crystallopoietes]EMY33637.1 protein tyrosine phosphatase [Arthrobacter crystallopoietes BAB-32]